MKVRSLAGREEKNGSKRTLHQRTKVKDSFVRVHGNVERLKKMRVLTWSTEGLSVKLRDNV